MGNLRSVAQAVHAAAEGLDVEVAGRLRPAAGARRRSHRAARPRGDARLHGAFRRQRRARCGALRGGERQAPAGRLRRHADAAGAQRGAGHPRPGPLPGRGAALPAGRPPAGGRQPLTRCRRWAGTASTSPRPIRCWDGIASGSHFYFVHSYYAAPAQAGRGGGPHPLWRAVCLRHRPGYHFCHPVPPREICRRRPEAVSELSPGNPGYHAC